MLILVEANVIEDEKFCLGAKVGGISDTAALQIIYGFASDVAGVAGIILASNRVADVADQYQRLGCEEGIYESGFRHWLYQHVGLVYGLPAPDARAVETKTCFKHVFVHFSRWHGEVLPEPGKVHEPEINDLDLFFLHQFQHVFGCVW